jgi:diketogulonate reductase-like aldo/keto reductase
VAKRPSITIAHPENAQRFSRCVFNNGVEMPMLGLGMFKMIPGRSSHLSLAWALQAGYRLIDTAYIYNNEADVGAVVRECGLPRDQLFVTTKLWNADQGYDRALHAFEQSLRTLQLDYVDLYLIHWPVAGKRDESWRALQRIYAEGRARAIGVSNYTVRHLEQLLGWADVVPAVNQVELSPFLSQRDVLEYCRAHRIQVEAYSPLTRKRRLNDPVIAEIATRLGVEPAQVILRWVVQHGVVALFKSVHQGHIRRNARIFDFELSDEEMATLDALDEGLRIGWDPAGIE